MLKIEERDHMNKNRPKWNALVDLEQTKTNFITEQLHLYPLKLIGFSDNINTIFNISQD